MTELEGTGGWANDLLNSMDSGTGPLRGDRTWEAIKEWKAFRRDSSFSRKGATESLVRRSRNAFLDGYRAIGPVPLDRSDDTSAIDLFQAARVAGVARNKGKFAGIWPGSPCSFLGLVDSGWFVAGRRGVRSDVVRFS